jgi:hypothetical protein
VKVPTTTSTWDVKPDIGEDGPFHAIAPDGTEHGPFETWQKAMAHCNEQLDLIAERELHTKALELLPLIKAMQARGATRICATYDGSGDDGSLNEFEVTGTDPTAEEREALEDYFEEALNERHTGWENGDGGFGEFVIALDGETIVIEHEHNDYVEDYDTTEHSDSLVPEVPPGERVLESAEA